MSTASTTTTPPPRSNLSVTASLRGKHVLITGATGFLGKCVVEKVLRSVPSVGKVYLLIRPRKGSTAAKRMEAEIVGSPIFNRLRKELGEEGFRRRVADKLVALAGDITQSEVGLSERNLKLMFDRLNVVIHSAAIVDFNARIDRAMELNTRGSLRLMSIAKRCKNITAFVHVSTAYVNCNQPEGWVDEKLYDLGHDPDVTMKKIEQMELSELEKVTVTGNTGTWPNTYTYTKAMAEELMVRHRGKVPLAIVRPSIIGSSHREPVPGWIDVISAMSAMAVAVGLGVVHFMPGKYSTIGDLVPVDYVVNSILAAVPNIESQPQVAMICQATSTVEKPLTWTIPTRAFVEHFEMQPPKNAIGRPWYYWISSPQWYQIQFFMRYSVPSAILNTIALVGGPKQKHLAAQMNKLVWKARVLTEVFRPFVTKQWFFDNKNNRTNWNSLSPEERTLFDMDLSRVDWFDFFKSFSYGISEFILHQDMIPVAEENLSKRIGLIAHNENEAILQRNFLQQKFYDVDWAVDRYLTRPTFPQSRELKEMHSIVLTSPEVQAAIDQHVAAHPKVTRAQAQLEARRIIEKMAGKTKLSTMSSLSYVFRKIWRRLYDELLVDTVGLAKVKKAAAAGPVIFLPTHRSYIDFLVVSYLCLALELPLPYIAAGEDFLGIAIVRTLFRNSGAFFIRRSFADDPLYSTIFSRYVEQLLVDGQSIEFFIEGTRSRSGKMLQPKQGLLSVVTKSFLKGKVPNATLVPLAINYEKTIEGPLYSNELQGESKIRESLRSLLSATSVLKFNFGTISVQFGEPISLKAYTAQQMAASSGGGGGGGGVGAADASSSSMTVAKYSDALLRDRVSFRKFNRDLSFQILYDLSRCVQCMPTHLVATLMLMYRQGITRSQLAEKIDWLRLEVTRRGGQVLCAEGNSRTAIMDNAIKHLRALVLERRQHVYEPAIQGRDEYKNMLALGHYRNRIVHLFFRESLWACALYAFGDLSHHGVEKAALLEEVKFLYSLLNLEFIIKPNPDEPEDFESALQSMLDQGILQKTPNQLIEVAPTGETHFSFLCALLWPFIDSYYVATMILFSLQPHRELDEPTLLQRTQWLATTLYHESMLSFYESCSKETLNNAFAILRSWKVIEVVKRTQRKKTVRVVRLLAPYHEEHALQKLSEHINRLRKPPAVRKDHGKGLRRNLIADIPILAKL